MLSKWTVRGVVGLISRRTGAVKTSGGRVTALIPSGGSSGALERVAGMVMPAEVLGFRMGGPFKMKG